MKICIGTLGTLAYNFANMRITKEINFADLRIFAKINFDISRCFLWILSNPCLDFDPHVSIVSIVSFCLVGIGLFNCC